MSGSSASCVTPWRRPVSGPDEQPCPGWAAPASPTTCGRWAYARGVFPGALRPPPGRPVGARPATLAGALRDVLGPAGTLLVPTHTDGNSTTSRAHLAAVAAMDRAQRDRYEAALPAGTAGPPRRNGWAFSPSTSGAPRCRTQ
ncbi:AAC(3) family N-acetyltransferase [Micromonospora sp. M12]